MNVWKNVDSAVARRALSVMTDPENQLKWSNELRLEEGKSLKYQSSFRVYMRLPRLDKKLRLVIMEDTRNTQPQGLGGGKPYLKSGPKNGQSF